MTTKTQQFIDICLKEWGDEPRVVTSRDIQHVAKKHKTKTIWGVLNKDNKAGKRGQYHFPPVDTVAMAPTAVAIKTKNIAPPVPMTVVSTANLSVQTDGFSDNLIPSKDPLFVPFGNFKVVRDIIKSRMFYPVWQR